MQWKIECWKFERKYLKINKKKNFAKVKCEDKNKTKMRILVAAFVISLLAVSSHALDSEESADRDDFYDSRGEFKFFFSNFLSTYTHTRLKVCLIEKKISTFVYSFYFCTNSWHFAETSSYSFFVSPLLQARKTNLGFHRKIYFVLFNIKIESNW